MAEGSAYDASTVSGDLEHELDRLKNQALLGWDKESRNLKWFGLRDGMSILEVGPGPGFVTAQLLEMLPNARITGLELDPVLIEEWRGNVEGVAEGRADIVQGNVMEPPLPEASFDLAYARLVFQHLPDPYGAARQILRLLKPGGKLVIFDIDDDVNVIFDPPAPPEIKAIQEKLDAEHLAKGGDRHIGRKLWRILKAAGYEKLDLEPFFSHSDAVGLLPMLNYPKESDLDPFVEAGKITKAESDFMWADLIEFMGSEYPYMLVTVFMACGEKPGG